MDYSNILNYGSRAIYPALGLVALYGVFCVVLLVRRIRQKRFSNESTAQKFLEEVREHMQRRDFDAVSDLCDSPPYWSKAVPQLVLLAMQNRDRTMTQLRRTLGEKFERDVLSDLEYRTSWIATIVKSAPMLGLLGTVLGMIGAFAKIADMQQTGTDPSQLAGDISFALFTTAAGLTVAIPLVMAGNMIQVRIGKLQDAVELHLGEFLNDLTAALDAEKGTAA
jgi:biopolymer transport protein ExbB/TolQ